MYTSKVIGILKFQVSSHAIHRMSNSGVAPQAWAQRLGLASLHIWTGATIEDGGFLFPRRLINKRIFQEQWSHFWVVLCHLLCFIIISLYISYYFLCF